MRLPTSVAAIGILSTSLALTASTSSSQPQAATADPMLQAALQSTQHFLITEQAISKTDPNFDVVVTSAKDAQGKRESVYIRTGTTRIFRADDGLDEFTKQGGWYWNNGETKAQTRFNQSGALIMVVREMDGTVRWYALGVDYRC